MFKKYSLELNSSLEPYSSVSENVSKNVKKYEKEANKWDFSWVNLSIKIENYLRRLSHLNKIIENHQSSKIRLSEKDLKVNKIFKVDQNNSFFTKIVVLETAKIIKKHYLDSILNFMNKKPHALFVENNLRDDDWKGKIQNLF